jgi:hypothetical protein
MEAEPMRSRILALTLAAALVGCTTLAGLFSEWDRENIYGRISAGQAADCLGPESVWERKNPNLGSPVEGDRAVHHQAGLLLELVPGEVMAAYFYGTISSEQAVCMNAAPWAKRNDHLGPVLTGTLILDKTLSEMLGDLWKDKK